MGQKRSARFARDSLGMTLRPVGIRTVGMACSSDTVWKGGYDSSVGMTATLLPSG